MERRLKLTLHFKELRSDLFGNRYGSDQFLARSWLI